MRRVARQQFDDFRRNTHTRKIDGRYVQHTPHGNSQVLLADVGFVDNELDEARPPFFLLFKQFLDLPRRQQAVLDECVSDAFSE